MQIGLFGTFMSPRADRALIKDVAQRAEAIGVDSLWMGERSFPTPAQKTASCRSLPAAGCWIPWLPLATWQR